MPFSSQRDGYMERANASLEEAAARLRELLQEAASQLEPFPSFYGSLTVRAIEAEPPQSQSSDLGCVVVCPDGELYELEVNFNPSPLGFSNNMEREEKLTKLDLPALTYISYAHSALSEVSKLLARSGRA